MKATIQICEALLKRMHADLSRPHAFAAERVGFVTCTAKHTELGWRLTAASYESVPDQGYIDDPSVGAAVSGNVFRTYLQRAHGEPISVIHVHRHDHCGKPAFSAVDRHESERFVPDFLNVRPELPHGVLVLSYDNAQALIWDPLELKRPSAASIQILTTHEPLNHHEQSSQPTELPRREFGRE
ncbi:MAG: hypothetical protein HOQ33_20580, partial [Cupriavidus sp.]|nr:hypothetical protein [Cupriavidus sp.]